MKRESILFVDHPYYASDSNFYSNEPSRSYDTFPEFYAEYGDADTDMNLIIRWDLHLRYEDRKDMGYSMQVIIIGQRKGIYFPIQIKCYWGEDDEMAIPLFQKHFEKLKEIWAPLSTGIITPPTEEDLK